MVRWFFLRGCVASLLVAGGIAVGWLAFPAEAEACSCVHDAELVTPLQGTHPANAGFLTVAYCGSGESIGFRALVDGVDVPLVETASTRPFTLYGLETPATKGQEVVIERCYLDTFDQTFECPDASAWEPQGAFVAGPVDRVGPPGGGTVTLQHGEVLRDFCWDAHIAFTAQLEGLDQGEEIDVLYRATLETPAGFVIDAVSEHVSEPISDLSFHFQATHAQLDFPAEDHCVRITAQDLAGNQVDVAQTCGSVDQGDPDPGSSTSGGSTGDDDTMSASTTDTVPDDMDPDGTTSSEPQPPDTDDGNDSAADDDAIVRGCACTMQPSRGMVLPLAALVLIFCRRRRLALS